jgi:hypothetical protein
VPATQKGNDTHERVKPVTSRSDVYILGQGTPGQKVLSIWPQMQGKSFFCPPHHIYGTAQTATPRSSRGPLTYDVVPKAEKWYTAVMRN